MGSPAENDEFVEELARLLATAYAHAGIEVTRSFAFGRDEIPTLETGGKIYIVIKNQNNLGTKELPPL